MKTEVFDCVEMKRRGAAKVQRRIARMSQKQELDFWRNETEQLRRLQQKRTREHDGRVAGRRPGRKGG